uniref:B30.2/SPRY domain-containing protein n=1 Tax=Chelonoidis abingdonii TaxID=106734 RepID=A0A8C0GEI9_CHEAB
MELHFVPDFISNSDPGTTGFLIPHPSSNSLSFLLQPLPFSHLTRLCAISHDPRFPHVLVSLCAPQRQTEVERQLVVSKCKWLHQFLAEQECLLLAQLGELDKEIGRRREENATHLCKEISQLSTLIMELEGKCQQSVPELLQVRRVQQILVLLPRPVSSVPVRLGWVCPIPALMRCELDVTLDPDTAHPKFVLSEDRKHVRLGDTRQDLPDNPERFYPCVCVLGTKGFMGERHYWEVEVGDKTRWTLGVCRESVSRKRKVTASLRNGYWVMQLRDGEYEVLTSPSTPLHVNIRPSRVGIFLDYEAGEVSFYNVTDRSRLFTFTGTFSGTLRPYFYPGPNTGGTNVAPLIICPVPAQVGGNLCP